MHNYGHLKSGWLGDLPVDFVDSFLSLGSWVRVPSGGIVYGAGADGAELFGIASGLARLHVAINEHEQRLAHICGPGFWFGDFEFVAETQRSMEFDAAEDLLLMRIQRNDFEKFARSVPDAWRWIALLIAQHAGLAVSAADDLMLPSAELRVVATLLRLSGRRFAHPASPPLTEIPITQLDLAVAANLSRSSTGSILRRLRQADEISIDYGKIIIRDADAMANRLR